MHAVDQEFAKNIENDLWREYMVFKETGNPDHPNARFSIGNSETLSQHSPERIEKMALAILYRSKKCAWFFIPLCRSTL